MKQQQDVVDVANLLQIKKAFLNRNKNLMYGVLRFLLGPLLALIVMHDSVRRIISHSLSYNVTYLAVCIIFLYLSCALLFDLVAYWKPLPQIKLSNNQLKLLEWPVEYPADLIVSPTTTVLQDELQKIKAQQSPAPTPSLTTLSSPVPSSASTTTTPFASSTLPSSSSSSSYVSQTPVRSTPAPSYAQTPAYSPSPLLSSRFSYTPAPSVPQTPAPAPSPFTLATPIPASNSTPATTTQQYPHTPYSFASPQQQQQSQTFSSPQQSFASPQPFGTPYPTISTPYSPATPSMGTTANPITPAVTQTPGYTSSSTPYTPQTPSQVVSPSNTNSASKRTRFAFANTEITTESSLRRYMESVRANSVVSSPAPSASIGSRVYPSPTSSNTPLPKYRTSFNGPPRSQSPIPEVPVLEEDAYAYQASAKNALQDEGILYCMGDYVEKMQEWLGSRLLRYVATYADIYLGRLEPQNQQHWTAYYPHIQAFLDMSSYGFTQPNSADYIARRIKDLQQGAVISKFNWCRGSEGELSNLPWDARYPTDAQLIMHLFCTFLDYHLVADPTQPNGKAFTSKYFARSTNFSGRTAVPLILQKNASPPHFELVLPDNKVWPVQQGYNNLFHTMVCFIHHITQSHNGYLGPISIADPKINLSWVVEEYANEYRPSR